ncbi:MAG: DEAD/DEAH box helicase [Bacteroidetes bacterium]|nr:DEAD/DEAH box helicase [Bacteroidota bacterium]
MKSFEELGLDTSILKALKDAGYENPTPVQEGTIEWAVEGHDVLGCAQTGTGKTAAFTLPILQRIVGRNDKGIKALVLAPTRELAMQIANSLRDYSKYMKVRHTVIYGGVSAYEQIKNLRRGVDVLIATPGRLLDLHNQGHVFLGKVETLVLDEADRMLDMGFIHDIKTIESLCAEDKQTLFFSATMPPDVRKLAMGILKEPKQLDIAPAEQKVDRIEQEMYMVRRDRKRAMLNYWLENNPEGQVLIFTKTKRGADRVEEDLQEQGYRAVAIHGDKSQGARTRALGDFKRNKARILVATDVASRGIDVDQLPYVINVDMPENAETYVHRIGRTGRAGAFGKAISFCCEDDRDILHEIEKHLSMELAKTTDHPFVLQDNVLAEVLEKPQRGLSRSGGPSRGYKGRSGGGRYGGNRRGGSGRSGEYRGSGDNRGRSSDRGGERSNERSGERSGERRGERSYGGGNRGGSSFKSKERSGSGSSSAGGAKKKFFSGVAKKK